MIEPLDEELRRALDAERARPPPSEVELARLASRLDSVFSAPPAPVASGHPVISRIVSTVTVLAVGAVAGALMHAQWGEPRVVTIERRVEVPGLQPAPSTPLPLEVPPTDAPARAKRPVTIRGTEPTPSERERLLIEQATAALARGNPEHALEACERHARDFVHGQLAEERESLAIRALVGLGRQEDARERATRFRAEFPDGLLVDVVEAALDGGS